MIHFSTTHNTVSVTVDTMFCSITTNSGYKRLVGSKEDVVELLVLQLLLCEEVIVNQPPDIDVLHTIESNTVPSGIKTRAYVQEAARFVTRKSGILIHSLNLLALRIFFDTSVQAVPFMKDSEECVDSPLFYIISTHHAAQPFAANRYGQNQL